MCIRDRSKTKQHKAKKPKINTLIYKTTLIGSRTFTIPTAPSTIIISPKPPIIIDTKANIEVSPTFTTRAIFICTSVDSIKEPIE